VERSTEKNVAWYAGAQTVLGIEALLNLTCSAAAGKAFRSEATSRVYMNEVFAPHVKWSQLISTIWASGRQLPVFTFILIAKIVHLPRKGAATDYEGIWKLILNQIIGDNTMALIDLASVNLLPEAKQLTHQAFVGIPSNPNVVLGIRNAVMTLAVTGESKGFETNRKNLENAGDQLLKFYQQFLEHQENGEDEESIDRRMLKLIAVLASYDELKQGTLYDTTFKFIHQELAQTRGKSLSFMGAEEIKKEEETEGDGRWKDEWNTVADKLGRHLFANSWFGGRKEDVFVLVLLKLIRSSNFYDAARLVVNPGGQSPTTSTKISEQISALKTFVENALDRLRNGVSYTMPYWLRCSLMNDVYIMECRELIKKL
jgi:hypothetical protein